MKVLLNKKLVMSTVILALCGSVFTSCSNEVPTSPKTETVEPKKEDPSKAWNSFYELDQHALNTTEAQEENLDSLVAYLLQPCKTQQEKARVLFIWTASHVKFNGNATRNSDANVVFADRSASGEGISNLMIAMGKKAGLETKKEVGYVKGDEYVQGQKFNAVNHTWNTIKTEGKWGVYDVAWAANNGEEIDDYWFNVPSDEYIFTHLPKKKAAQLMKWKMTLSQFEKLANPGKHFFKLGFNVKTAKRLALSGRIKEFATAFPVAIPIKMVKAPYLKELPSNKSFKIEIATKYAESIEVVNGGGASSFDKKGDVFSIEIELNSGIMELRVKGKDQESFETFLQYEVVDKNGSPAA